MDSMDIDEYSQNYETKPRRKKRRLSDEEKTIFNYMTGMYEKVKKSKTLDTEDISTIENYGTVTENDAIESAISLSNFISLSDTEIDVVINDVYDGASNSSTSPGSSQDGGTMKYKCYDCIYETLHISSLEEHSIEHLDSNFKCSQHQQLQENCLQCIYQKCLPTLNAPSENPTIHVDSGSEESILKKLQCSTCSFETIHPSYLRNHVCFQKNREQMQKTNSTISSKCRKEVDSDESSNADLQEQGSSIARSTAEDIPEPTGNQLKTKRTRAKVEHSCFHCSFVAKSRDLLKFHTVKHYKQKFNCTMHLNTNVDRCNGCEYQVILKELENEVFHCEECDFKTLREVAFLKHKRNCRKSVEIGRTSDSAAIKPTFRCFDCNFETWRKHYLQNHASEHKSSRFECHEHSELIDNCIKCVYKSCLLNLNQENVQRGLESNVSVSNEYNFVAKLVEARQAERLVELHSHQNTSQTQGAREKPADLSSSTSEVNTKVRNDDEGYVPENYHNSNSIELAPPNVNQQCESESNDENMDTRSRSQLQLNDEGHVSDFESRNSITVSSNEIEYENGSQVTSNLELNYYKCFECDFTTNKRRHLQTHANEHDGSFKCVEHYGLKATCLKCVYQDCALQTSIEGKSRQFKCFDCRYRTNLRGHLQRHSLKHMDSNYTCPIHLVLNLKCDMCYYKNCLSKLESKKLKCADCDYTTFRNALLAKHKCPGKRQSSHINQKYYKCFDCDYRTLKKGHLQQHASRHEDSNYSCPIHLFPNLKCDMCFYNNCLRKLVSKKLKCDGCDYTTFRSDRLASHKCPAKPQSSHINQKYYKCFDCDYRTSRKEHLQQHAFRHEDSKYSCPNHRVLDVKCDMCFYRKCVEKLSSKMRICDDCGYRNYRSIRFARHKCGSTRNRKYRKVVDSVCSDAVSTGFKCLHCSFVAKSKDLLKSHAVEHYKQDFKCSVHLGTKVDKCNSCEYEQILKEVRDKVFHCQKCDFKTLRKLIFSRHLNKSCQKSEAEGTSASSGIRPMPYSKDIERMDSNSSDTVLHIEGGRLARSTAEDFPGSTGNQHKTQRNSSIESAPPNGSQQCESKSNDEGMETRNRSQRQLNNEDHVSDFESEDAITLSSNELDSEKDTSNLRESNQTSIEGKRKPFKCFDCSYRTNSSGHLQRHSWNHRDSNYSCPIHSVLNLKCDMCFYMNCLRKLESMKLKCPTCSYETLIKANFAQHLYSLGHRKQRQRKKSMPSNKCPEKVNSKYSVKTRQFKCFDCSYKTYLSSSLHRHSWKHRDSNYSCPVHAVPNLKCDMCYYKNCLRKKLESKKLKCDSCDYTTFRNDCFASHMCPAKRQRSDINQKYYKCFDCDYRTLRKEHLKLHASRHEDSKYSCPNHRVPDVKCDMCFYRKCVENLSSRMRRICDDCDYTTYNKSHLDRHRKRMHHKK